MNLPFFLILSKLLFLSLFCRSKCQQEYIENRNAICSKQPPISKGYLCHGPQKNSCTSFLTFRSKPPYDTPISISHLLGTEANQIALANNISSIDDKITPNKMVIVKVSCSCSSEYFYQYLTSYTAMGSPRYIDIANDTFQGLTTCQALMSQNYYEKANIYAGKELKVPLRCACPSENQAANGVTNLLTYIVTPGDWIGKIAKEFGTTEESILEANMLSKKSTIYAFTTLLVPLWIENSMANPNHSSKTFL